MKLSILVLIVLFCGCIEDDPNSYIEIDEVGEHVYVRCLIGEPKDVSVLDNWVVVECWED